MPLSVMRLAVVLALLATLAACGGKPQAVQAPPSDPRYAETVDGGIVIPAVDPGYLVGSNARTEVTYTGGDAPGTIVVDPHARVLYLVQEGGTAVRYGIAVGREGYGFSGNANVRRKEMWPSWTPTANMIRRDPQKNLKYAGGVPGGLGNPLGARAMYLYRGGHDTNFRIHGTNQPSSIGYAMSSGCIRMLNHDVIDLYGRAGVGTRVYVIQA